jgi:hypothetical protein
MEKPVILREDWESDPWPHFIRKVNIKKVIIEDGHPDSG